MANITGLITINGKQVLEVDSDPSSGLGTSASIGSLALLESSGVGSLYVKIAASDTAWQLLSTSTAEDIQDIIGGMFANSSNISLSYDDALNQVSADLINTSVSAGSYGAADSVASFTVDAKGRLTSASEVSIEISASQVSDFSSAADARITLQKGEADGIVPLNASSKIDAVYLPSFVDDVEEYANLSAFPLVGEISKIYVALDTNKTYRWSGSIYIQITSGAVDTVNGQTGVVLLDATHIEYVADGISIEDKLAEIDSGFTGGDAALQSELDTTQLGAGLNTDGTYTVTNNGVGSFIVGTTSLKGSINALDSGLIGLDGALGQEIIDRAAADSALQTELDATQSGAGLGTNGAYTAPVSSNYLASATSLKNADELLDDQIKTVADDLAQEVLDRQAAIAAVDHGSILGLSDDDHVQYALLAGRSGGQSLVGGNAANNNLNLSSTSNGAKGKINLGANAAFDEATTRLGVGSNSPESILHLQENNVKYNVSAHSTSTSGAVNAVIASLSTTNNSVELVKVSITGIRTNGSNESVSYERTLRIKNNAGTVSIPTVQSDYTSEDGVLSAANVTAIISGSSVDIRVTGVASSDITWKAIVNRMR
jgi:hypothetical protein